MRQTANREPKFHQAEMLDGAGRSIRELLIILVGGGIFECWVPLVYFWISRIVVRIVRAKEPR